MFNYFNIDINSKGVECKIIEQEDPTAWLFKLSNKVFGNFFRIEYSLWTDIVYIFGKELHQSYTEILKMPMYEIFLLLDKFQEDAERQNKQSKADRESNQNMMSSAQSAQQSMMQQMQQNYAKNYNFPSIPNFG